MHGKPKPPSQTFKGVDEPSLQCLFAVVAPTQSARPRVAARRYRFRSCSRIHFVSELRRLVRVPRYW